MLQHWIFLICAVAAFLFVLICWIWPIWRTQGLRAKDRDKAAELEDNYRKTVAQVLGGAAIVVAFSWTFLKDQRTLEQGQHDSAGKQFAELAALLNENNGKDSASSRAAAIYAFEGVVKADESYSLPIQNTLITLIAAESEARSSDEGPPASIASDIRAAFYILGRLEPPKRNYNFDRQYLVGSNSVDARSLVKATFRGAKLYKSDFSGADLTDVTFEGASMSDWEAFGKRDGEWITPDSLLKKDWVDFEYVPYTTYFNGANLTNANFYRVVLNGVHFEGATLEGTNFREANIGRADFRGAIGVEKAHFEKAYYTDPFKPVGLPDAIMAVVEVHRP